MRPNFNIGDKVEKIDGYTFRGVIISVYQKLNGEWRVDVEVALEDYNGCKCPSCLDPNGVGMIHVFNPAQLRLARQYPV